jgi:hypothetical protein
MPTIRPKGRYPSTAVKKFFLINKKVPCFPRKDQESKREICVETTWRSESNACVTGFCSLNKASVSQFLEAVAAVMMIHRIAALFDDYWRIAVVDRSLANNNRLLDNHWLTVGLSSELTSHWCGLHR